MILRLTKDEILQIKQGSISRKNFAVNMMRKLYDETERRSSNVRGKAGKDQLNPARMMYMYVNDETLKWYPAHGSQLEKQKAWSACILVIEEANRRLNRKNI